MEEGDSVTGAGSLSRSRRGPCSGSWSRRGDRALPLLGMLPRAEGVEAVPQLLSALPLAFHLLCWPSPRERPRHPGKVSPETEGRLGGRGTPRGNSRAAPPWEGRGGLRGERDTDCRCEHGSARCLAGRIWSMKTWGWKAREAGGKGSTWLPEVFPAEADAWVTLSRS